jgi:hypothetical protein
MVGRRPIAVYRVDDEDAGPADLDPFSDGFFDEPRAEAPAPVRSRPVSRRAPWALALVAALVAAVVLIGVAVRAVRSGVGGSLPSLMPTVTGGRAPTPAGGGSSSGRRRGWGMVRGGARRDGLGATGGATRRVAGVASGGARGVAAGGAGAQVSGQPGADARTGPATGRRAAAAAAAEFGFER